jgi:hypothetical protein
MVKLIINSGDGNNENKKIVTDDTRVPAGKVKAKFSIVKPQIACDPREEQKDKYLKSNFNNGHDIINT